MILRKSYHLLYGVLVVALTLSDLHCQQAPKTYAEDDWIPIAPKRSPSPQPVVDNVEKKATGRVLNLADPSANNFFPEEMKTSRQNSNLQQYLRETTNYAKVPVPVVNAAPVRVKAPSIHPYKFESPRQAPSRSPSPQKAYYIPAVPQQFIPYYRPDEYHTIPEEFLNQPLAPQPFYGQNYDLSDLTPLRLNTTSTQTKLESAPQKFEIDKENIQLLYVPLESLAPQTKPQAFQQAPLADLPAPFINYRPSSTKQQHLSNIQNDFAKQAMEAHRLQLQLQQEPQNVEDYAVPAMEPVQITTTTRKPTSKKRKAHQPPLAVYMGGTSETDIGDVLALLKNAKSIDVQDSVGPNSPNIFVGPSTLVTPRGYAKFDLPYLSSLDSNRVDRKVDQYPFFVAPLSYKTPSGYSKIPLPSPHVGSVVVSTKEKENVAKPDAYQEYTIEQTPFSPTTPLDDKVVKQYEEVNAFIPQFQGTPSRDPESIRLHEIVRNPDAFQLKEEEVPHRLPEAYNAENYQPSTSPTRPPLTEQLFIDEILQQQQKPTRTEYESEFQPQRGGQYFTDVTRLEPIQEQLEAQEYPQPARIPTRSRTTPPSQSEQYEDNVTKSSRGRSKPTRTRESYDSSTRPTHLRTRPTTTTTPSTTTTEAVEQYHRESFIESRPSLRPSVDSPKYPIQDQISHGRSTSSPSSIQEYSPVTPEYDAEVQSHRPVIYKYKQSDEDVQEYPGPVYQTTQATPPPNQHTLNQDILDAKVLSNQPTGTGNYVSGPGQIYQFQEEYEPKEQVKTQNANVENYNIGIQLPQTQAQHIQLPNLINNLEDQSVRQLLHPGLIPTSPKPSEGERYEIRTHTPLSTPEPVTSNYPSTHLPIVETTTTRKSVSRGRVRGSRFSTTTPDPVLSTRRAPVSRGRRPLPSRSKPADDDSTTEETIVRATPDPTSRIVTARSRFRSRGRPAGETTSRIISTPYEDVTQSIPHRQPSVQIIDTSATPRINPEYISYRPVYNIPSDGNEPILLSTKKVSKPATEPVVIHQINQLPIKNLEEENTENTSSKLRTRGRRPSTTVAPQSTARNFEEEPNEKDDEFYGFFRKPAFNKPTETTPTPESSRPVYSSTYISSTLKPQIDNVQFVGEIRPKYQSPTQHSDVSHASVSTDRMYTGLNQEVEEEQPRIKTRARIPSRRVVTVDTKDDEETRTTVRTRSRGRTQYRMPQKAKRTHDSSEDEDVEGGNYPVQFKALQTTARPSFQITVDPHDQDQEGFASIYHPTYVTKENNNKASPQGHTVEFYQRPNYLPTPNNDIPIALPSIASAPEVNSAIEEEQERVRQNEKGIAQYMDDIHQDYEDANGKSKDIHTEMGKESFDDNDDDNESTTIAPKTTTPKRRRGVWKLVRRPVDVLEGAESQNSASIQNQVHEHFTKPYHEETVSETTVTNDPSKSEEENTTLPLSPATSTPERPSGNGFIDTLYNMFGISTMKAKPEVDETENMRTTTEGAERIDETTIVPEEDEIGEETTTVPPTEVDASTPLTSMTYITPMSLETWNMKTSTSTEISQETEICYKGKCVKSKDMKVPMT